MNLILFRLLSWVLICCSPYFQLLLPASINFFSPWRLHIIVSTMCYNLYFVSLSANISIWNLDSSGWSLKIEATPTLLVMVVCDILMYFLIPLNLNQSWIYFKKCDSYILFISYSWSIFNRYYYFWMKRVLCKLFNRLVEVKKPPYSMQLLVMMISHNSCACKWEQGRIWGKRGCQLRGEGATQSATCCTMSMCKRGSVGIWQKMLVDTN